MIYAAEATDTDERACRILHFGSLRASSGGEEDGTRSRVTYGKVWRRLPIGEDDSTLKKNAPLDRNPGPPLLDEIEFVMLLP